MAIKYPPAANTNIKKLAYMFRVKEKWKQLYNLMGKWFREGISVAEYDSLPLRVRSKIAYTPQLTENQWINVKGRLFKIRSTFQAEHQLRIKQIEDDTTFNPDPTDGAGDF